MPDGTTAASLVRRSFTVEEYHRMAEAGIHGEDDRVELLEGEIVEMTPIGSRHAACVRRIAHLAHGQGGGRAIISVQNPVRLSNRSEPQPDLTPLRPRHDFYASQHPGPEDALLLMEVAEASVEADRSVKVPFYARAGITEVWLVDVAGGAVEVYRRSAPPGYRATERLGRGASLSATALPGLTLGVSEVLASPR